MELALVSSDQTGAAPTMAEYISTFGGSLEVAIMRLVVSPDWSSSSKEVFESLKWKNSRMDQEMTIVTVRMTNKMRRLVKESELVPLRKGPSSFFPPKKFSSNKASKGKR